MATANSTSPSSPKTAKLSTPRRASTRAAASGSKAKATRAKAARTRSVHQTKAAVRQTETATRNTVEVFGDYAERAVLIPVGAALIARDRVVSSVNDVISSYSSPSKAQVQLRKFERRGSTARNRLEREVRKTRTRVERELRQRRNELDKRRDTVTKSISTQVEQTSTQVQSRLKEGADLAGRVQERVLSLV
jgi:prefoldin subunit 5